jgi:FdhE protein
LIRVTLDDWLASHPYLRSVADLQAGVEAAVSALAVPSAAAVPSFDDYAADFHDGVPLLESMRVVIDLAPAEDAVVALVEKLASTDLPGPLAGHCQALNVELQSNADALEAALAGAVAPGASAQQGVLRFVAWTVMARYLQPVVGAFARWRDDERWLRNGCPTCGGKPAMGQLVGHDPGRLRLLACGCCRTRWRYRRTGCPFCDNQHDHRLAVVAVEGEVGLRIDYCDACAGYLKTATGEGSEEVLLADWTSLHLDLLARDRGLRRMAGSLYSLWV